jgi:deoxyribodipyrimidine photo-lyase
MHPRTLLADLGERGRRRRRAASWPGATSTPTCCGTGRVGPRGAAAGDGALEYDEGPEADRRFEAWATGRTGYPFVDAGMRQLLGEAWVHNRVRMVVASFLTKDLHLHWRRGARHFMQHLRDGDLAATSTAGSGWPAPAATPRPTSASSTP